MAAPLVVTDPAATALVGSALLAWLVLEASLARRGRTGPNLDEGSRWAVVSGYGGAIVAAAVAALTASPAVMPGKRWTPVLIGVAVIGAGLTVRVWAVRTLGRWFTYTVQVAPGQRVVTDGPYRRVRHPSYAGALLCSGGFGLTLGNWLSVALGALLPVPGVLYRVRVEERALLRAFGAEYAAYRDRTQHLVPWVW